jgi:peptidoglycan/xylan/chitin deacetylase (PgdA/CDA1 family)
VTVPTRVPVLLYHSVDEDPVPGFRRWTVTPELFAAHMSHLAAGGWEPVTMSAYVDALTGRAKLSDRIVVITFDDGFADFTAALPALRAHGFASTLYVTTGGVGSTSRWLTPCGAGDKEMLTWDQIAALPDDRVEIGAHAHTHRPLDAIPIGEARQEIETSTRLIAECLGRPVQTFAYPHGYSCHAVRDFVAATGHTSAAGVKHAMSGSGDDPFSVARIIVEADTGLDAFDRLLAGEGLRVAPRREQLRTAAWRWVRRTRARVGRQDATPVGVG